VLALGTPAAQVVAPSYLFLLRAENTPEQTLSHKAWGFTTPKKFQAPQKVTGSSLAAYTRRQPPAFRITTPALLSAELEPSPVEREKNKNIILRFVTVT